MTSFAQIQNILLNDFESLFAQFYDPEGELTNVSSPAMSIYSERMDPSDPDRVQITGTPFNVTTGVYGYTLSPSQVDSLGPGLFHVEFTGTLTSGLAPGAPYDNVTLPQDLVVCGEFQVQSCTPELAVVLAIRRRLKDLNTRLYRLDLPTQKWTNEEVLDAVEQGIDEINAHGPMKTTFLLSTLPPGVIAWVRDIAFAQLLESGAILENWNTYSMGDGSANLNLARANLINQIATATRTRVDQKVAKWKRSLTPDLYGQGTNQYPFQIRHVISFLPNYKNIFGG
jgi:hypothetical protein